MLVFDAVFLCFILCAAVVHGDVGLRFYFFSFQDSFFFHHHLFFSSANPRSLLLHHSNSAISSFSDPRQRDLNSHPIGPHHANLVNAHKLTFKRRSPLPIPHAPFSRHANAAWSQLDAPLNPEVHAGPGRVRWQRPKYLGAPTEGVPTPEWTHWCCSHPLERVGYVALSM